MQIYNFGWIGLPIGLYFIYKRYFLHTGELWLLFYANLLLLSTFFDAWICQLTHLIMVTAMSTHVLSVCKQTNGFISQRKLNVFYKVIFHLQQQLTIFVYTISAWLFLRVYTNKTSQFGIGETYDNGKIFQGVNTTLQGWNCTQLQFVLIPFIWLVFNSLGYLVGCFIIIVQRDKDNMYKQFTLKYKVLPDILFSLIAFSYNYYSYYNSVTIFDCSKYWQQYGYIMQLSVYYGFSVSTLYLFYVKKGVFQVEIDQNTSDKAEYQDRGGVQMNNVN